MTAKPVIPREQARRDVEAAVDFYATEAGETVALRFIDAVEAAYGRSAAIRRRARPDTVTSLTFPACAAGC